MKNTFFNGKFNGRQCYSSLSEFISDHSQDNIKHNTYDYSLGLSIESAEYRVSNIEE